MASHRPVFAPPESVQVVRTERGSFISGGIIVAVLWLLILYTLGVYLFEQYEGWNALDAIYFVTVTVTTIGYGDITPHTGIGKILTIVIAWTGISVAFYLMYQLATYRDRWLDRHIMHRIGSHTESVKELIRGRNRK